MKSKSLKLLLILWIALWIFFMAKNLFIKGTLHDYNILLSRSTEGRRSYVTGDRFYEFLTFCNNNVPKGATYRLIGVDDESIERRRAVYYLYPHLEKLNPDFILIYNGSNAALKGYDLFATLDNDRYIMRKKEL